ncbi:DUF4396 domain-containing protein [Aspergillus stella-maris]|uniref:DUF4396 domain-containing protein n=1 Tax=Aspergillus stella-maris TaxID=1810926 RepID=UPI003CCD166D
MFKVPRTYLSCRTQILPCVRPCYLSSLQVSPRRSSTCTSNSKHQTCNARDQNMKRPPLSLSPWARPFWTCRSTWKRAGINTLRCLVGCTLGDFSALWTLQTYAPAFGMGTIMGISMASGITTSILLETVLLHRGLDCLPWGIAFRTATGMSLVSMLAMEVAENVVDYHLTGGVVDLSSPGFWGAAVVSVGAGFLAPLPWNFYRLRRYGRACH